MKIQIKLENSKVNLNEILVVFELNKNPEIINPGKCNEINKTMLNNVNIQTNIYKRTYKMIIAQCEHFYRVLFANCLEQITLWFMFKYFISTWNFLLFFFNY